MAAGKIAGQSTSAIARAEGVSRDWAAKQSATRRLSPTAAGSEAGPGWRYRFPSVFHAAKKIDNPHTQRLGLTYSGRKEDRSPRARKSWPLNRDRGEDQGWRSYRDAGERHQNPTLNKSCAPRSNPETPVIMKLGRS